MPRKRALKLGCPICKKPVLASAADFPFCSERCREVDLGKWASGQYVVQSPTADVEEEIRSSMPEDLDEQE